MVCVPNQCNLDHTSRDVRDEEEEEVGELRERGDVRCESCRGERRPADDPRKGNSTGDCERM